MSHELVYTSAQQGLKPGSYGFCTVMATEGITKVLQDRLESLSGYEHAYALSDRSARLNPVNFSYLILTVANQRLHLLSRIADAGADYSGRSNKLAHHVALQPNELTAAGPAWTLASPGFCKTEFGNTPKSLSYGILPPPNPRPFAICTAWKTVCQDAGWAGVLAEMTLKNPSRPITLIYPAGTNVLPLVVEAMSLLPADRQWRTTFSTFFTKLPAGIECQWRFVLDGTPVADMARRNLQSPPIDLASPGPIPFAGPLVEAARSGKLAAAVTKTASPVQTAKQATPDLATPITLETYDRPVDENSDTYRLAARPPQHRPSHVVRQAYDDPFAKPRSSNLLLISAIVGGIMLFAVTVGIGLFIFGTGPQPRPLVNKQGNGQESNAVAIEKPEALKNLEATTGVAKKEDPKPEIAPEIHENVKPANPIPPEPPQKEKRLVSIFMDIERKGKILTLPKREQGVNADSVEPQALGEIDLKQLSDFKLQLRSLEQRDGEPRLFLLPGLEPTPEKRLWSVMERGGKDIGGNPITIQIGQFVLQKDKETCILKFAWDMQAPNWSNPFRLTLCTLDLKAENQEITCKLSKPVRHPVAKLDLSNLKQSLPLGIELQGLGSIESLRYDIELHWDNSSDGRYVVNANKMNSTRIFVPEGGSPDGENGDERVEIEFRFVPPTNTREAELSYAAFVFPTIIREIKDGAGSGENSVPEWRFETKRTDEFDKSLKDGSILAHFKSGQKYGSKYKKSATDSLSEIKRKIARAEEDIRDANLDEDKAKYRAEIRNLEKWKPHYEEVIEQCKKVDAWIAEMKQRFADIEKKLQVRYCVYLDFGNERVVLAETIPSPVRSESQTEKVKDKGTNK